MPKMSAAEFFAYVSEWAKRDYEQSGVLPSITVAQALKESTWGKSELASKYNNLFGVKASPSWTGKTVYMCNKEGKDCATYRAYDSMDESLADHSGLFRRQAETYKDFWEAKNYEEAAHALTGVYADDKNYGESLVNDFIKPYNLDALDEGKNPSMDGLIPPLDDVVDDKINEGADKLKDMFGGWGEFISDKMSDVGFYVIGAAAVLIGLVFLLNNEGGQA